MFVHLTPWLYLFFTARRLKSKPLIVDCHNNTTRACRHYGVLFHVFLSHVALGGAGGPPPPIFARKMFLTLTKRKLNSKEVGTTFFLVGGGAYKTKVYSSSDSNRRKNFFFRMCLLDQCKFIIPKHYSCQQLYI